MNVPESVHFHVCNDIPDRFTLKIKFGDDEPWVIKAWKSRPSKQSVDDVIDIAARSIEVYRRSITITVDPPSYDGVARWFV